MKKILGVILVIGFVHRLLLLGRRQLWTDELMQALIVRAPTAGELLKNLREGQSAPAPLDYFIQKGVVLLLGDSNWALRLHAVIFGTLAIWFFFRIAYLLFDKRVALYSTFLFAFFPLQYHYSQEGRPYSLFLFLTLVSYDLLLRRIYGKGGRWTQWLLLCAGMVLLLYQSFLGLLVLGSQLLGLVVTVYYRPARATPGVSGGDTGSEIPCTQWSQVLVYAVVALVAVIAFLPWIQFAWSKPLLAKPSEIMNPKLALRLIKELGDNSYPVAVLILGGAIAGIRALVRHGRQRTLLWLLTWLVPSIPALLAIECWSGYFFAVRQVLHVTPALVLLAGYGLSYVGERLTILQELPYQLSAPAMVYAALLCLLSIGIAAVHSTKEPVDWRGTAQFLIQTARPGDAISIPVVSPLLEYYAPRLGAFQVSDLDPGPGSLARGEFKRRIVVCYAGLNPDPCQGFRAPALADSAWIKRTFPGFRVFIRSAPTP